MRLVEQHIIRRTDPRIDQATKENYARSMSDEDSVTRIDIFGSYPNYSPLVFDSVLKPAAQQWAQGARPLGLPAREGVDVLGPAAGGAWGLLPCLGA